HALTGDLDIIDEVKQAEFFLVDGIIVTGQRTTDPPDIIELRRVKRGARVPVMVGSGMDLKNIAKYLNAADGFIVGSTFREEGRFLGKLDAERLEKFMKVLEMLRNKAHPRAES